MTTDDLIETMQVINSYGEETVATMREILVSSGKSASGELVQSLSFSIEVNGSSLDLQFQMADYGQFVDKGRKPGKQPPIASLTNWLSIRGIPQQFAFPIARKIGREGIKPTPFFESTIERTQADFIDRVTIAFAKDIENYIQFKLK